MSAAFMEIVDVAPATWLTDLRLPCSASGQCDVQRGGHDWGHMMAWMATTTAFRIGGPGSAVRSPLFTLAPGGRTPGNAVDGDDANGDQTLDFGSVGDGLRWQPRLQRREQQRHLRSRES